MTKIPGSGLGRSGGKATDEGGVDTEKYITYGAGRALGLLMSVLQQLVGDTAGGAGIERAGERSLF